MNISCTHEPKVKVIRLSIGDVEKLEPVDALAIISLCDSCWTNMKTVIAAADAVPDVVVDDVKVVRVLNRPEILDKEG